MCYKKNNKNKKQKITTGKGKEKKMRRQGKEKPSTFDQRSFLSSCYLQDI